MDLFALVCDIILRAATVGIMVWVMLMVGSVVMDRLLIRWDGWRDRVATRKLQKTMSLRVSMDEHMRKDTEIKLMRQLLRDSKLLAEQCLGTADEREDMVVFLMNQERRRNDEDPLDILFVGEALDDVRARMGKARKHEGPPKVKAEDIVIDAGILCHFVDQLKREQGIEPPPAFYKLQQVLREIKPAQRKKS